MANELERKKSIRARQQLLSSVDDMTDADLLRSLGIIAAEIRNRHDTITYAMLGAVLDQIEREEEA